MTEIPVQRSVSTKIPRMIFGVIAIALGLMTASQCRAQDPASPQFAVFGGVGMTLSQGHSQGALQLGASFDEAPPNAGFGLLLEGGYVAPWSNFKAGSGIFSANYMTTWKTDRQEKLLPFATAGYSHLFGTGNAVNFGGGVDYRLNNAHAIRIEIRDYYSFSEPRQNNVALRIGWVVYVPD
jgi:hypothetical protein